MSPLGLAHPVLAPGETMNSKPHLHVPHPPARPGDKPDFSYVALSPAGAVPRPDPAAADLNALLSRLERAMRQRISRRVGFRLSLLPELWGCRAEPPTVRALVLDLVAAAGDDLKDSGELVVGTRNYAFDAAALADTPGALLGEYVRVTVRDSGPGLSEAGLERVFDPATTPRRASSCAWRPGPQPTSSTRSPTRSPSAAITKSTSCTVPLVNE